MKISLLDCFKQCEEKKFVPLLYDKMKYLRFSLALYFK